ncbi:MAG: 2-C-methyl-D-erythritol 4-phosphate cytidylyltransferase [Candidatus Binataceae bacterium]
MRASAIVVAAGSGQRLGLDQPKAFVKVGAHSMLARVLATLKSVSTVLEIVVAVPAGAEKSARAQANAAGVAIPVKITAGGAERQDSVRIALALTSAESDLVLVHDAARPFATRDLFERCLDAASRSGAAISAIPVADTLKRVVDGAIAATVARAGLWQAQTPQAFRRNLLVDAHTRAAAQTLGATDDAELVERIGGSVEVVEGSATNIKITTLADLAIARAIAMLEREN